MLRVEGLEAWYGSIQALFGVDLTVLAGQTLGVVGTNGAGKSTTVRGILGLVKTAGTVEVDGVDVSRWPTHKRVTKAGMMVVHEGRSVFPRLTVRENLLLGKRVDRRDGIGAALELFPALAPRLDEVVGLLSGGQRQMVALGRAVIQQPKVLLLDEPSLGLAPLVVDEIYEAMRQMSGSGMAVLLVEQSIVRARTLADNLLLISMGSSASLVGRDDGEGVARLERIAFGGGAEEAARKGGDPLEWQTHAPAEGGGSS